MSENKTYRIHLIVNDKTNKSRKFCLKNNLLALGWPVFDMVQGERQTVIDIDTYKETILKNKDNYKGYLNKKQTDLSTGLKKALNALSAIAVGDFCWTKDKEGHYYLGRVNSQQIYIHPNSGKDGTNYREIGLYKTVDEWRPLEMDETPGKVISCLISCGTLQHIKSDAITQCSAKLCGNEINLSSGVFEILIHADDLEDLLGLYLQKECGYYLFPSTNKLGTTAYEYMLVNSEGQKAVVQCKIGGSNIDVTPFKDEKYKDYKIYLTTLDGTLINMESNTGKSPSNIEFIPFSRLHNWAKDNTTILPARLQKFIEWVK